MADKRGGKRPGAGRKAGGLSRATKEQKGTLGELARQYTDIAMATLARVAAKSDNDSAAVAAANSILDRAYGRPRQAIEHTGANGGPIAITDLSNLTDDQLAALEPVLSALAASGAPPGASTH